MPDEAIRRSATEVNEAAADLSERAARQAASLEKTAAALQRTNQGIQSGSELAQELKSEAALACQNAAENRTIVENAADATAEIKASVDEVTNVSKLIQNLAFQTNILALNAGVEATRSIAVESAASLTSQALKIYDQHCLWAARAHLDSALVIMTRN